MSRLFGPIAHFGYAVEDIQAAMRHWTADLGVGPFLYAPEVRLSGFEYRGTPGEPLVAIATAVTGSVGIELVQPLDDSPSAYLDFIRRRGTGQQHIGFSSTTMDYHLELALSMGWIVLQRTTSGGGRSVHFDTDGDFPGTVVQLSEVSSEKLSKAKLERELADTWDGSHPIRPRSPVGSGRG